VPQPVAALVEARALVADDGAVKIEIPGVEHLGQREAGIRQHRRSAEEIAENAAEGDVAFIRQPGISPDRDAPLVLRPANGFSGFVIERPGQVDARQLGPEAR
jgi:hypothetical protein